MLMLHVIELHRVDLFYLAAEYANYTMLMNSTNSSSSEMVVLTGSPEHREVWQVRMREVCT